MEAVMKDKHKVREGIPLSDEEKKESEKCWKDMEDSIEILYKKSKKK